MELSVSHQLFVFVCMVLCGAATGIVFDGFRAFRRCVKSGSGIIAAQDLALWLAELVIVYCTAFKVNNAQIRAYEAIALVLGALIYFVTLSELVMKLFCKIIKLLQKIIRALLSPVKKLLKIAVMPFTKLLGFVKAKTKFIINYTTKAKMWINLKVKSIFSEKKRKI